MRILFIHGRSQGDKTSQSLLKEWKAALDKGLHAAGLELPKSVTFDQPFYGKKLDDFVERARLPSSSQIVAMGPGEDPGYGLFMQSFLQQINAQTEISDDEIRAEMPPDQLQEMGPQNWGWIRAIVKVIDKKWPEISGKTIEAFLTDVYLYLDKPVVRKKINEIIEAELTSEPTVVVAHSLGTVVGYDVLLKNAARINLAGFITIGSPLGIRAISGMLGLPRNPAPGLWFNAFDRRDIVALNPLDANNFPVAPQITNYSRVKNHTSNRHGIAGYLDSKKIAKKVVAFAS